MQSPILPIQKKKGVALILTLGVLFMMGLIVGSFAFFTTSANRSTSEFMNTITASNLANSGYNYIVGAIQDYFNTLIPEFIKLRSTADYNSAHSKWKEKKEDLDGKNKDLKKKKKALKWKTDELNRKENNLITEKKKNNPNQTKIFNLEKDIANLKEVLILNLNKDILSLQTKIDSFTLGEEPTVQAKAKISSNEFNALQSSLTNFLNGEDASFAKTNFKSIQAHGVSLDKVMFTNEDSWAHKYKFIKSGVSNATKGKYDIDLDGVNNYFDPGTQLAWAKSVLNVVDGSLLSSTSNTTTNTAPPPTPKQFAEENVAKEQKDADWHTFLNEQGNAFGRFAVMAKDQSSLINIESTLSQASLTDLIVAAKPDADDSVVTTQIDELTTDSQQEDLNTIMQTIGVDSKSNPGAYTSSSTDNSNHIDVNTASPMDFFQYLNADRDPTAEVDAIKKRATTNAKIAANLNDYTDSNSIPFALTKYNWTKKQLTDDAPWAGLTDTDIFYGMEGIRISEVMIHPEQAFSFPNPLTLTMKC